MDIKKYAEQFDKFYVITDKVKIKDKDGVESENFVFKSEFVINSFGKFEKQTNSLEELTQFIETIIKVKNEVKNGTINTR